MIQKRLGEMSNNIDEEKDSSEQRIVSNSFLARRPLTWFFVLAYAFTWISVLPLVLSAQGLMSVPLVWHFIGAFGPAIAAFIMVYATNGFIGMKKLAGRCVQWMGLRFWILISFLGPIILVLSSLVIDFALNGSWFDWNAYAIDNQLTSLYDVIIWLIPFVSYGIFEEIGWRGFALPRLQKKYSALVATTILWVFWAPWHTPMFFYRFSYDIGMAIGFFIGMYVGALIFTFILNSSRGSVLTTILWHTVYNVVSVLGGYMVQASVSMIMMALAIVIVLKYGWRNLSTGEKYVTDS
jgi:membrane protease YdiL (CAAX protease family)